MNKYFFLIFLLIAGIFSVQAQKIQSPSEFLGYKLGDQFTPHHRVVDYYNYLASVSKNIQLQEYGKTNEGRPLLLAFVGSDSNISRLDQIRKYNLNLAGINEQSSVSSSKEISSDQPVVVWLSYNVHGNESVSTEASLQTIYELVNPANQQTKELLADKNPGNK